MFQKTTAFRIFFWVSLILIGFFIFFPLLWLINTALKPTSETFSSYFFVGPLTLDNIIPVSYTHLFAVSVTSVME